MNQQGKLIVLVFFVSVCATASILYWHQKSQTVEARPSELYHVVHEQLKAFQKNNLESAYSQASAKFQQRWSLDDFSAMIHTSFAKIMEARSVEFGGHQQRGKHAMVEVYFIDDEGMASPCIFTLVHESEGWKVDGARWIKGWPNGQRMRGIRS
jgi:hypothetical protein